MFRYLPAAALLTVCGLAVPIGAQTDTDTRAVYRYRVAIASLLQLKPGMAAAEIGPAPGFLAKVMEGQVAPGGRAVAQPSIAALDPASLDAVALVDYFTASTPPGDVFHSVAAALKPGGAMLVVDVAREGTGADQKGIDAEEAISQAAAAGFKREAESGIVPGHFAIRFRKP